MSNVERERERHRERKRFKEKEKKESEHAHTCPWPALISKRYDIDNVRKRREVRLKSCIVKATHTHSWNICPQWSLQRKNYIVFFTTMRFRRREHTSYQNFSRATRDWYLCTHDTFLLRSSSTLWGAVEANLARLFILRRRLQNCEWDFWIEAASDAKVQSPVSSISSYNSNYSTFIYNL